MDNEGIYFTPPGCCPGCGSQSLFFIQKEYNLSYLDSKGHPHYDESVTKNSVYCGICGFTSPAEIGSDGIISLLSKVDRYQYPRETDGKLDNIDEKTFEGNPFIV
jgi:hypothetical protein